MKNTFQLAVVCMMAFFISCSPARNITNQDNQKIDIRFVQINDVYEIDAIAGGKEGGMARVATVKKQSLQKNKNSFLVIAGDFLSPSVYNSLSYEGKRIRGKQMVEAMNAAGVDIAVFGNHEFDIKEDELQERLNESHFQWISSNSFHKRNSEILPFAKQKANGLEPIPQTWIMDVSDEDGTRAKIGFIGINIPFTKVDYVKYTDPLETAVRLYHQIKDSCDAVVAITHQAETDDILLAKTLPGLALIIGGHEHDMRYDKIGNVIISKAHANARSVYELDLHIDQKKKKNTVKSKLRMLDASVPFDSATQELVKKWTDIANASYASLGFDARKIVWQKGPELDGREAEIRQRKTNFTRLIVHALEQAAPQSEVAIINSGSIRVDDILQAPISQYDIIRTLPFGGGIEEVEMKGSLLKQILEVGRNNTGSGGFLQYSETLFYDAIQEKWTFQKSEIPDDKIFRVAITSFLLTGGEANMSFLTPDNPGIIKVYPTKEGAKNPLSDVRLAIIQYMERHLPQP